MTPMMRMMALMVCGVWLTVSAAVAQQTAAPQAGEDPRLQDMLEFCFACHGEGGVSRVPSRPTIAGQKPDYIMRQLRAFKHAAEARQGGAEEIPRTLRSDPVMDHVVQGLPESLIPKLAAAVGNLSCDGKADERAKTKSAASPKPPAVAARCTACHGVDGISTQPHIPNLAGQQRAYLRRQLLLIRETAWGAEPLPGEAWRSHPIMEVQVARLSIKDVDALAKYYAQLDCRGGGTR